MSTPPSFEEPVDGTEGLTSFGLRLRFARCLRGLTMTALEQKSGRSGVSRTETEPTYEPGYSIPIAWADALSLGEDGDAWLLRGKGSAPRAGAVVDLECRGKHHRVEVRGGDPKELAIQTLHFLEVPPVKAVLREEELRAAADETSARGRDYEWWLATVVTRLADRARRHEALKRVEQGRAKSKSRANHQR